MRAFDAKLVQAGKLNPVTYIFRAKNYYGMTDKQEVEVTKTNQLGDNLTDDELAKKLMKETEVIDVEASEAEEQQATITHALSDYQATMPSDYETHTET